MNNKEFINELARRNEMKAVDAQAWMNTLLGAMGDNFLEGNAVQLPNFGVFEVKKKERIIINPSTGQRMLVPPKLTLAFKPTPQTKEKIKKGGEANG